MESRLANDALVVYDIHENPVSLNGSCATVGALLDLYKNTKTPLCSTTDPGECEVGDLSGKHGNATGLDYVQT